MSDRCSEPDAVLIEETAIAALPSRPGPKFRAWIGDADNLNVIHVGNLREVCKRGRQRKSTNVILFEEDADAASVPCSEPMPNDLDDEAVFATADILRPVYDVSGGRAGFVSFALPRPFGDDARGMAAAARRVWYGARRPNVLVQIPASPAGITAIFRLIPEAVSVHATHIASYEVYRRVAEAYIAGLRHRAECGLPISGIASFATLPASGGNRDLERAADAHGEFFSEDAFSDLRRLGARSQTLLRQPMRNTRSRSRHVVSLRSDDGQAGGVALDAIASRRTEQA